MFGAQSKSDLKENPVLHFLREPEIDESQVSFRSEPHVVRTNTAVRHPLFIGLHQHPRQLERELQGLLFRKRSVAPDPVLEAVSFHEFTDEEIVAVGLAGREGPRHVLELVNGCRLGLFLEVFEVEQVVVQPQGEHFDGDVVGGEFRLCAKGHAVVSGAQLLGDIVFPNVRQALDIQRHADHFPALLNFFIIQQFQSGRDLIDGRSIRIGLAPPPEIFRLDLRQPVLLNRI